MKHRHYSPIPCKSEYSESFKREVVREVMGGVLTKDGAKRKYNIGGNTTVLRWCRQYGDQNKIGVKMKIMTQQESDDFETLKRRNKELEESLEDSRFKNDVLETLIKVAESDLGVSIRKKSGAKPSGK